jgi:soluble lytic murein transglycosylase
MKAGSARPQPVVRQRPYSPWGARLALGTFSLLVLFLLWKHHQRQKSLAWREKFFAPLIEETAERHGLPPSLVKAVVWRESQYDPHCRGKCGEIGLMQLMEGAVYDWAKASGCSVPSSGQLFNPELNVEIGSWYLARAMSHWQDYAEPEILALAEYNAGYSRVDKMWRPKDKSQKLSADSISFPGTRDYIILILRKRKEYDSKYPVQQQPSTPDAK